MKKSNKNYLPAIRSELLMRFYDPIVRITTREFSFKRALIKQAKLRKNQTILDLACGTGTLAVAIKRNFPESNVFGFDVDEEILQTACRKAQKYQTEINFGCSFSEALPFENEEFDRVFSTLAFHHLTRESKVKTLREISRILKFDGELHLADYGLPQNKSQLFLSKFIRAIDGFETTNDNHRGRLKLLMKKNGFSHVERTAYYQTIFGTIRLFRALK